MPITYRADSLPLQAVLDGVLSPMKLDFYVPRGDVLVVTTTNEASLRYVSRVYALKFSSPANRLNPDFSSLMESIRRQVNPRTWNSVGGAGSLISSAYPVPCLVISNTYRAHRDIQTRFGRQLQLIVGTQQAPPSDLKIPGRLWEVCSITVDQMTLQDFIAYLGNSFDLPVTVDAKALEKYKLTPDVKVQGGTFTEVRLVTVVERLLNPLQLGWLVNDDGTLMFTTRDEISKQLISVNYRVGPLVGSSASAPDFDSLTAIIRSVIAPATWEGVGGRGSLNPRGRSTLVIKQTFYIHMSISSLLDQLRAAGT